MKLTIGARELASAAALAAEGLDPKSKIPALHAARLRADGGLLRIGTNILDWSIEASAPAEIEVTGSCAPPAAPLSKLAASFPPSATILLAAGNGSLRVQCGRASYRLPIIPLADLPIMPEIKEEARVELARDQAIRAFGRPGFSVSHEKTQYYLNGILLRDSGGGLIRTAGTDGHRLASIISTASQFSGGDCGDRGIIIPRETVALALKLLQARKPETVALRRSRTLIQIIADGFSLTSKLIDATFPDYERLIPGPQPNRATVDRIKLIEALQRLAAVAERESKTLLGAVGLEWAEGDTEIRLTLSRQPDAGTDLIEAELTGSARIAFNVGLLLEQLEELEGERVRFDVNGHGAAMITDPGDEGLVTLLMPCTW